MQGGREAIEALYPAIRERREAQGFRCGNTTLHGYHVLLKSFFQKAVDYDLIGRNPCNRVEPEGRQAAAAGAVPR